MTIIPLHNLWIDANFKENQLRHIRIGQPVKITTDIYGGSVEYHGKVIGLGAGTGSVFSLLPAQNATGNWIKVVQRVPVRVALDNDELDKHPLRVGLSTDVTVDITNDKGPVLASAPQQPPAQTVGVRPGRRAGRCGSREDHPRQPRHFRRHLTTDICLASPSWPPHPITQHR